MEEAEAEAEAATDEEGLFKANTVNEEEEEEEEEGEEEEESLFRGYRREREGPRARPRYPGVENVIQGRRERVKGVAAHKDT